MTTPELRKRVLLEYLSDETLIINEVKNDIEYIEIEGDVNEYIPTFRRITTIITEYNNEKYSRVLSGEHKTVML